MPELITPEMADEMIDERRARGLWIEKERSFNHGYGWNVTLPDRYTSARPRPANCVSAMDPSDLIPRDQWPDLIAQKDEERSWLGDVVRFKQHPCVDQKSTNYCHAFSTVQAIQDKRCVQGHPYLRLSSMSIGGPITGWRNKGEWPENDLMQAVKYGACPFSYQDSEWSFNPRRWKKGWEKAAEDYQVDEWTDGMIPGKAFDAMVTFALRGIPCMCSAKWWSHAFNGGYAVRRESGGGYSALFRNTWGSDYKDDGFFWMREGTRKGQGTSDITLFGLRSMGATG